MEYAYSVKVVASLDHISTMRRWLVDNCGRRWYGTDYRNRTVNWRRVSQQTKRQDFLSKIYNKADRTLLLHFQKYDDMMLFLLVWPGEVVVNRQIDSPTESVDDK